MLKNLSLVFSLAFSSLPLQPDIDIISYQCPPMLPIGPKAHNNDEITHGNGEGRPTCLWQRHPPVHGSVNQTTLSNAPHATHRAKGPQ